MEADEEMEQGQGLQNTKTAGYILIVNSQSTIHLVSNWINEPYLYWVQSNELLRDYSGEESGRVTCLLIQEIEVLPYMVPMYGFFF